MRWTLAALALVLVVGIGIARVTRPARFSGEPMDHWLDSLGSLEQTNLRTVLRQHPIRQTLASEVPRVIPELEREVRGSVDVLLRSRQQYQNSASAWAFLGRAFPGRFGIRPPAHNQAVEEWTRRRIHWGTALILDLSPDAPTALDRLDALARPLPPHIRIDLSSAFAAIEDPQRAFCAALTNRLRSPDSGLHPYWISCLGNLAEQAAHEVGLVQSLAREGSGDTRVEAIKALGYLDVREGAATLVAANATDQPSRQAAVIALMRMGPRAAPARQFLESCLRGQDVVTAMFAQVALRNLTSPEPAGK